MQVTVARLQSGDVKPLGLRALLDACSKSHLVKHVNLSNHDLSSPRLFSLVVTLGQQARDLRLLSLCDANISDQHALDLAAAIQSASHSRLEGLDVSSNKCDPHVCWPLLARAFINHLKRLLCRQWETCLQLPRPDCCVSHHTVSRVLTRLV